MTTPILESYHRDGKPLSIRFDDHVILASKKQFSSGSVGWYASGKVKLLCGDDYVPVQVSMILTVIGSKNSHGPQIAPEAREGTKAVLLGPEYAYNEKGPQGPILGQDGAVPDTARHNEDTAVNKKKRRTRSK